jgi:hypothetical protein
MPVVVAPQDMLRPIIKRKYFFTVKLHSVTFGVLLLEQIAVQKVFFTV